MTEISRDATQRFIAKWQGVIASELSTSQSFLIDLCTLLGVEAPHATAAQDYMFERPITFAHGDGSQSAGRIDLYRRGAFVLESKKLKAATQSKGFDDALLRARSQAEGYARALPAGEGRPPFLVVVDVGNRIELYSEFSRSGATYTPYPDPRSHRIALADLAQPELLDRLRRVWVDPLSLDPSRESAKVTREIAARLAELAKSLERAGHSPEAVAQFLMRCLFTMFAEDVRLLPAESFRNLLATHLERPDVAMRMLANLWRDMDSGGFSAAIAGDVLRFNGKLFKQPDTLPLDQEQLALLIEAARADWKHVEPAIFGTLLERALTPSDRHKLGAHYTPRAYVERLVLPTVIEPLRQEWSDAQAAAMTLAAEGKHDEAVIALQRFHHRLCTVRVLDPACGSGNFLYVTLEHLKRLEGEVLNALDELGYRQPGLALGGERADAMGGETVDPHNLLGIELNPRAAAIAEVVLWIGYLQWHYRTRGNVNPPVPVIRDFRNIENRDAVLAYDSVEWVLDASGRPVTRWDGRTMKKSPVTGEDIPDDTARIPLERYTNPRKAQWPQADFVVGNPPFIGAASVRRALGDGYADALRATWNDVPESADFVMHWWHHAADLTRHGKLERFGFITTNSIRQTFNRRVIEAALLPSPPGRRAGDEGGIAAKPPSSGARLPSPPGRRAGDEGGIAAKPPSSGARLPSPPGRRAGDEGGIATEPPSSGAARHLLPVGEGKQKQQSGGEGKKRARLPEDAVFFARELRKTMTDPEQMMWSLLRDRRLQNRKFRRQHPFPPYTLDFYCHELLLAVELDGSQHLDSQTDARRDAMLKDAGIETIRYWNHDVTNRTEDVLEDIWNRMLARADACLPSPLGRRVGDEGGVAEELPSSSACLPSPLGRRVGDEGGVAEELPSSSACLPSPPGRRAGDEGSIAEELPHPPFGHLLPMGEGTMEMTRDEAKRAFDEAILERLVALNAERAAEEARGLVRWLRPEFQNPGATRKPEQVELAADTPQDEDAVIDTAPVAIKPLPWPKDAIEQVRAVADVLSASVVALSVDDIAARFSGRGPWKKRLPQMLDMLVALGRARQGDGVYASGH